jgi:two-component system response regulator FixJ
MSPLSGHGLRPPAEAPVVVLVDDDSALRTALTFTLELDGFVVQAYASGEALLQAKLPAWPACLVFDFNLQGMNGLALLEALRDRAVTLPALLITSHPPRGVRAAAIDLAATIIEKPLLTDALTRAIHTAFAGPGQDGP